MNSAVWFEYFSKNQRPDAQIDSPCGVGLAPAVRAQLADSIARFQLGEASGGRIAQEVETARDPALDGDNRRAIQLYVLEEGRHARELYQLLLGLGGRGLTQHWSSDWFRRVRRSLGLRTKMLTMAVAEVVGIVYYSRVAERAGCPTVLRTLRVIEAEECRHLDFQAEWFGHAVSRAPKLLRPVHALSLASRFALIFAAALLCLLVDHRRLLRSLDVGLLDFARHCVLEVSRRLPLLRAQRKVAALRNAATHSALPSMSSS